MRANIADQLRGFRNRTAASQGTDELPQGKPRDLPDSRTLVYRGAGEIVSVKVASRSHTMRLTHHVGRPYVSIIRSVKGGHVMLYLYGRDGQPIEELLGSTVRAELDSIMLRTYPDGKVNAYVDLKVVEDVRPTHDLTVIGRACDSKGIQGMIFAYPVPGTDGVIELRTHVPKPGRKDVEA